MRFYFGCVFVSTGLYFSLLLVLLPFSCCQSVLNKRAERRLFSDSHRFTFVEQVVLSRGKVIMKLSHCQQPYWIDGLKTERTLCLNLSKPVGLRSDDGVCPRQKYPLALSVCVFTWVYVVQRNSLCGSCVFAHIQALLAKMSMLRSLRKCSCLLPLSNKKKKLSCDVINRFETSTYEIRNDFFCSAAILFVDNSKFLA